MHDEIRRLAAEQDAVILAHYYQTMDIQNVADQVGDSFELARFAAQTDHRVIVLCGVRFMAESAKLLAPDKTVLLPAPDAGCPMADMVTAEDVEALRRRHPHAAVMCYVNSSAEVKAQSDVCCTSSSAVTIARALPERDILFLPDRNLGAYVAGQLPEKNIILYPGYCPIHDYVTADMAHAAKAAHPDAPFLAHPECRAEVLALADFIGSTAAILKWAAESTHRTFIIGTEEGVVQRLKTLCPDKTFFLLHDRFICPNMKKTRMADLLHALHTGREAVQVDECVAEPARQALARMVALGS